MASNASLLLATSASPGCTLSSHQGPSGLELWLNPEKCHGIGPLSDVIGSATPFFFLFMAIELGASVARGRKVYNTRQTINNLSAGILTVLLGLFLKPLYVFPYHALHSRLGARLLPPPSATSPAVQLAVHLACLLGCDFFFYWFHRACHVSNLGWSAHVVHHSSPDFNLSTALRQGAGETVFSWAFYLPLALFCPVQMFVLHKGANAVYQFFTHTQLVGKLWWPLELVLNTPSHHRVHHARNYGRRNYAGMLIVWDRLFGTFEEEDVDRRCIYGLDARRAPLGTFNPLWHQLHHLRSTLQLATTQGQVLEALLTRRYGKGMVMPSVTDAEPVGGEEELAGGCGAPTPAPLPPAPTPSPPPRGWVGGGKGVPQTEQDKVGEQGLPLAQYPWDARPLGFLDFYVVAHYFVGVVPLALVVLEGTRHLGAWGVAAGAAWSALAVTTLGILMDGTARGVQYELMRQAVQMIAAGSVLANSGGVGYSVGIGAGLVLWCVVATSALSVLALAFQLAGAGSRRGVEKMGAVANAEAKKRM